MKIRSISHCATNYGGAHFLPRRHFLPATLPFLAFGILLNTPALVWAQNTKPVAAPPPVVAPPAAPAPAPAAALVNVLILALDDLTVFDPEPVFIPDPITPNLATEAAPPALALPKTLPGVVPAPAPARNPAPITAAPILPAPLQPIAPAPPARAPIVPANPASYNTAWLQPHWVVNAQRTETPKQRAKREAAEAEAAKFRLEPDQGGAVGRNVPSLNSLPDTLNSRVELSPILPQNPPGLAQLTAIPLRRVLMTRGYTDVLTAAPDSTAIMRTIGENRLSPRVFDSLKKAVATLSQPTTPDPAAVTIATRSAVRIGQALGYRAVVVLYVTLPTKIETGFGGGFTMLLADSSKESGEPISIDETGTDESLLRDNGATSAAALLDKALRDWPIASNADRSTLALRHLDSARTALAAGNLNNAQDEANQVIALDPVRAEAFVIKGDALRSTDPQAAAVAYRRAVEINTKDGATWAKIAQAFAYAQTPDWPQTLSAAARSLAAGYDSAQLRVAMATAQYGRGTLFRKADRLDKAEDAEFEARTHLDRALELSPDDPGAVRLLAKALVTSRRYDEALKTLDRIAPRYPRDLEIQTQYATALSGQAGREEDAFVAYGRVWAIAGQTSVDIDAVTYRALGLGFDTREVNLGKTAAQLTTGVANGAFPRESAFLQLSKLKEDAAAAEKTINIMRPLAGVSAEASASRIFAADLMNQSLDAHQTYLETGQELYRGRGLELYRQAVARLNAARMSN